MNGIAKSFFELGCVTLKRVFYNQTAIKQKIERIVNCCQTHAVVLLHGVIQNFCIEMTFVSVYMFKNSVSFRSFTMLFLQDIR